METEKIIGNMCLMDGKYYWCSYQEQIITVVIHQLDQYLSLADADIHTYDGSCEFCAHCFNMKCEYNTDKNVSYVKANVTDIDWNEQSINNVQNKFQDMSNILHENSELIEMLNKNPIVISGYEWKFNK